MQALADSASWMHRAVHFARLIPSLIVAEHIYYLFSNLFGRITGCWSVHGRGLWQRTALQRAACEDQRNTALLAFHHIEYVFKHYSQLHSKTRASTEMHWPLAAAPLESN